MAKDKIEGIVQIRDEASQKLEKIGGGFDRVGESIARASKKAALIGGVIAAGVGLAGRQFAKFERGLGFINTMLDDSTRHFVPKYSEAISKMAMDYGVATQGLLRGGYDILSGMVPAEHAMKVLDTSARMAAAGMTEVNTSAYALVGTMNAFNIPFSEAEHVADVFFATIKRGQTDLASLAPNLGKVSTQAAAAGIELEDLMATIAAVTRAGVPTEIALTSIRGAINAFTSTTKEAEAIAKKYHIQLGLTGIKAYGGLLRAMGELAKLTDEELFAMVGEQRARTAIAAALSQQSRATEDLNAMYDASGRMMEAFEIATDDLSTSMGRLSESVKYLQRESFEPLAPAVEAAASAIGKLARAAAQIPEPFKSVLAYAVGLTGAVLLLGGALGILVAGLMKLGPALLAVTSSTVLWKAAIAVLGPAIAAAAGAIAGFELGKFVYRLVAGKEAFDDFMASWSAAPNKIKAVHEGMIDFLLGVEKASLRYQKAWAKTDPWIYARQSAREARKEISELNEKLQEVTHAPKYDPLHTAGYYNKRAEEIHARIKKLAQFVRTQEEWLRRHDQERHREWIQQRSERERMEGLDVGTLMAESLKTYEEEMTKAEAQTRELGVVTGEIVGHVSDLWIMAAERIEEVFARDMRRGWSDFYFDVISGTKSLGDAWNQFCLQMKSAFIRAIADMLAEQSVRMLFGGISAGAAGGPGVGGIGAAAGGIFGAIGSIFGLGKSPGGAGVKHGVELSYQRGGYVRRRGMVEPGEFVWNREITARHAAALDRVSRGMEAGELAIPEQKLVVYNVVDPNFVNAALIRDPSVVVNQIGADIMESGMTRKIIGGSL